MKSQLHDGQERAPLENLEVAAEAVSFQVAVFVLVQFDLEVFSDGVSHDDAALGHQLHKLFGARVGGQACERMATDQSSGTERTRKACYSPDT